MPEFSDNLLLAVLVFLLFEGGSGVVAYGALEYLSNHWPGFAALSSEVRRLASYALSAVIALGGYGLALWLGVAGPAPTTEQEWVTRLFGIVGMAIAASGAVHGRMKLSNRTSNDYDSQGRPWTTK